MQKKINKSYLEDYNKVILIQPLPKKNTLFQTLTLVDDNKWIATYSTNKECIYHVCPYDGIFRKCVECGALEDDFNTKYCTNKQAKLSTAAVCNRINDCLAAELEVKFIKEN